MRSHHRIYNHGMMLFLPLIILAGIASASATEIMDQRGKTHDLDIPAERVVFIPPVMWTYLTVDETDTHMVGTSAFAKRVIQSGLLGKIFPHATHIPDITSNRFFAPNLEAVLAVHPDVVFQTIQIGPDAYERLEQAGLKVIGITGVNGEEDFMSWTHLAGAVSGKHQKAQQLINRFQTERKRLDTLFADLADADRPKVLHLMGVEPLRPMVSGTSFDQAIRHAGGQNVAAELTKFGPVNFEQVLLWDPDVILISGWPEEKHTPADLFQSEKWSALRAVKNKRVYKIPLGGQRFEGIVEHPLYWQWLAELLHPTHTPHKFRKLFHETYQSIYDHTLTDAQIDQALYMQANQRSEGFNRFLAQ